MDQIRTPQLYIYIYIYISRGGVVSVPQICRVPTTIVYPRSPGSFVYPGSGAGAPGEAQTHGVRHEQARCSDPLFVGPSGQLLQIKALRGSSTWSLRHDQANGYSTRMSCELCNEFGRSSWGRRRLCALLSPPKIRVRKYG